MHHKLILSITSLVLLAGSFAASASGYSSGGYNNPQRDANRRAVDQTYELGKAIYTGRQQGEPSLEYCIAVDGEKVPVKRKTVKAYKGETYDDFARNLFHCDEPDKLISEGLTRDSFLYVVYYLNKRHKLELRGS